MDLINFITQKKTALAGAAKTQTKRQLMKHLDYTKDSINLLAPVPNEPIKYSRGKNHFDQPPEQRSAKDFAEFIKTIGTDRGNVKGEQFICAAMASGLHQGNPKKYIGENHWRLAALADPRLYLPLDVDGMLASIYEPLLETLKAFAGCIYTTSRHTEEKPRIRIILPLNRTTNYAEGQRLGKAFERWMSAQGITGINWDQSVYNGAQPCYLPLKSANFITLPGCSAINVDALLNSGFALDDDSDGTSVSHAVDDSFGDLTITEQIQFLNELKAKMTEYAQTARGEPKGYKAQKSASLRQAILDHASSLNWCWDCSYAGVMDGLFDALTTTDVNTLNRKQWVGAIAVAARIAPQGSPEADLIKSKIRAWSEKHKCYDGYLASGHDAPDFESIGGKDDPFNDFDSRWAEGERCGRKGASPFGQFWFMSNNRKAVPKLILADGTTRAFFEVDYIGDGKTLFKEVETTSTTSHGDLEKPQQLPLLTGSEAEIVSLFNQNHFVTTEGAQTFVFKETVDPELERATLYKITFNAFKGLHNQVTSIAGKPRRIAELWLNSTARRTYTNGIVFIPGGQCPDQTYNLWRGFGVNPVPGAIQPIVSYLQTLVCKSDNVNYQYLLNWLAYGVQKPERQGEVAVVLRGLKGVGKSTLGRLMLMIYGRHGMQITNSKHLVGNFNGHLRTTAFLFADEAFFAGDRIGENVLKGLVTEPQVVIEKKGIDSVVARNRLKILMCSNNEWVVPASADERRFFILDVSDEQKGQVEYWRQLNSTVKNGGAAAFLHHLQQIDLSQFNVRVVPNTVGLDSQKLQSLGVVESVIYNWLYHGRAGYEDWTSDDNFTMPCRTLTEALITHCKDNFRHRYDTPTPEIIGKKLKLLVGARRQQKRDGMGRDYIYVMPNLDEARKLFCQHIGLLHAPWDIDDLPTEDAA